MNRSGSNLFIISGNEAVANLLIENGVNINAREEDGGTPLDFAIFSGNSYDLIDKFFLGHETKKSSF